MWHLKLWYDLNNMTISYAAPALIPQCCGRFHKTFSKSSGTRLKCAFPRYL